MFLEISKFPIFIISTPRCGSTALAQTISNSLNFLKLFIEPDYIGKKSLENFNNYALNNNNYILKVHATNLKFYDERVINYLTKSSDVYKIHIKRKNIVEQIASFYIARFCRSNKWHFTEDNYQSETVPIILENIIASINKINYFNNELESLNVQYDLKLIYEDLLPFTKIDTISTPKPLNYIDLIKLIEKNI